MKTRSTFRTAWHLVATTAIVTLAFSGIGCGTIMHELQMHRLMRWNMATDVPRHAAYMSVPPPADAIARLRQGATPDALD